MPVLLECTGIFVGISLLLGLLVGSFLNVVIYRLPKMLENSWDQQCKIQLNLPIEATIKPAYNLVTPDSNCPSCDAKIRPWQNIPIISYLCLGGKCSQCKAHISLRYPIVELLTGLLFAAVAWRFGFGLQAVGGMVLTAFLVAMAFIDADTQLLPDGLTLPLLWLGLALSLKGVYIPVSEAVIGAMLGYLSLWSVYWVFKFFTGKEGMGYGDFKLLAALGAWLGALNLPVIILLSSIVGLFFAVVKRLNAKLSKGEAMPFGPYLACAGWLAFMFGNEIVAWWLSGSMH